MEIAWETFKDFLKLPPPQFPPPISQQDVVQAYTRMPEEPSSHDVVWDPGPNQREGAIFPVSQVPLPPLLLQLGTDTPPGLFPILEEVTEYLGGQDDP